MSTMYGRYFPALWRVPSVLLGDTVGTVREGTIITVEGDLNHCRDNIQSSCGFLYRTECPTQY